MSVQMRPGMWREIMNARKAFDDVLRFKDSVEPLSPTPASAEAGPAGASTVSTEDRQEQLRRMREREAAIHRELEIYLPLVARLKTAVSDLEEAIKRLEKEVEG